MKPPLLIALSLFVVVCGTAGAIQSGPSVESQVESIDAQIAELEAKKRGFEGRALRHENMAEYLQFDQRSVLETRRHLDLAEENRAKAALVQIEIDRLLLQKQKLQK